MGLARDVPAQILSHRDLVVYKGGLVVFQGGLEESDLKLEEMAQWPQLQAGLI